MILETLTLTNFRVFQGKHEFDLTPRVKYGKKRPIILYGGLNGAGKTTTLTAIRLALYGRQSLGLSTTQKNYFNFLKNSIHKSRNALIQANSSCIELAFSYANMGIIKHYTVKRHWMINGNKLIEKLSIAENSKELLELNDEQCQGFLNELIPIGVSDLFFFDSEKISELAEDNSGYALGDAIKKLLGLDLIDTLNADLTVLLRNESKKSSTIEVQKEITSLEEELDKHEKDADNEVVNYETTRSQLSEIDQQLKKLENDLSARGGAWAVTREKELEEQVSLNLKKDHLQKEIRELVDGSYPISIAESFVENTLKHLFDESAQKKANDTTSIIDKHLSSLKQNLKTIIENTDLMKINQLIDKEFGEITNQKAKTKIIHDISDSSLRTVDNTIQDAINTQKHKLQELGKELTSIDNKLDMAGKNIARAPEESLIKPIIEKINRTQENRVIILSEQRLYIENRKRHLRAAIETTRKLDKLSDLLITESQKGLTVQYATNTKAILNEFAKEMAKRKTKDLEGEFEKSFHLLARKEDVKLRARISYTDFSVKLIDDKGSEVDKDDLSAGEKQIYAIAILEALAKTSGRKLPIIIDTPLARLDSIHRTKLINNYFPYASHQVIILSTDTEVDEGFYEDLSSSISHAFKLEFDGQQRSTSAKEGYFWKTTQAEAV